MYKIYCDGASRSNPGEASIGISIQNDEQEIDMKSATGCEPVMTLFTKW